MHTKNYKNLKIVLQVRMENVGDVFLRHSVYTLFMHSFRRVQSDVTELN